MNVRGGQTPHDLDDWFDEPEPEPPRRPSRASVEVDPDTQTRERTATEADDWLAPTPPKRRRSLGSPPMWNRRIVIALAGAIAILLIGLALGGVFSSGGNKSANTPLTTQTSPTAPQSTAPAAPRLPAATVKLGDHGNSVKEVQRALRSLGYKIGTIDGVFGTSTQSALIAFQTAHHLTPDGVLGPATRAALLNALRPG